jgi:mRNA interferase MazF
MVRGNAPARGDVIWTDFSPASGHEQGGKRPAVVVSPQDYNGLIGLAIVCPVTFRIKNYPFEVPLAEGNIRGAALVDQIRAFDWKARRFKKAGTVSEVVVREIQSKLKLLLL